MNVPKLGSLLRLLVVSAIAAICCISVIMLVYPHRIGLLRMGNSSDMQSWGAWGLSNDGWIVAFVNVPGRLVRLVHTDEALKPEEQIGADVLRERGENEVAVTFYDVKSRRAVGGSRIYLAPVGSSMHPPHGESIDWWLPEGWFYFKVSAGRRIDNAVYPGVDDRVLLVNVVIPHWLVLVVLLLPPTVIGLMRFARKSASPKDGGVHGDPLENIGLTPKPSPGLSG